MLANDHENKLRKLIESGLISEQEAFALSNNQDRLPMGSMRNESTGKMTYFQPNQNAPRTQQDPGFSSTPYPVQAPQAPPRAKLYGVGGGQVIELGEDTAGAVPLDFSRPGIEIPGLGKAQYSRDGRLAVGRDANGQVFKAILGYDEEASDRRNAQALGRRKAVVDIAHTEQQTEASRANMEAQRLQAEQLRLKGEREALRPQLTPGQESLDKEFAKTYVEFKAGGGYSDVVKQLAQLREVSNALERDSSLTGPVRGLIPEAFRAMTNPAAVNARNTVEEVVQRNLRVVLGAQFTEREGERLIARAFNPQASTPENKKRVDRLIEQIHEAARVKEDASRYFEQKGSLSGWRGARNAAEAQALMEGEFLRGLEDRPVPPAAAVSAVKNDPSLSEQFIEKYGIEAARRYGVAK